jgi:2-C-methyl-D-erythritol 4-phosphate cytidylyltransferase
MVSASASRFFGLVPAAGGGTRFAASGDPKQYAPLAGQPMLCHSVMALLAVPEIESVFVVLAPGDELFRTLDWGPHASRIEPLYCGGATRRDSVLNGLVACAADAQADDWMLVHDAARPCLARDDLRRLIDTLKDGDEGGILATRVSDTLKRGDDADAIVGTEPRDGLWQAQTPQMFRYGALLRALRAAPHVTDEASALEQAGHRPRLVAGSRRNIKVTYPEDLQMAEWLVKGGA